MQAAGSESQLAHNLGAVPVAAVHDVRGPPTKVDTESHTKPVLISKPGLERRGSSTYYLLVPR